MDAEVEAPHFQIDPLNVQLSGEDSNKFTLTRMVSMSTPHSSFYRLDTLVSFDYETKSVYELEVNVFDGRFTAEASIEIHINDLNDNRPIFAKTHYEFKVDENSALNTFIGRLNATDKDRTIEMKKISYKIIEVLGKPFSQLAGLNQVFSLDSNTARLTVNSNELLDHELFEYFNLTVVAFNQDMSSPDMIDTCHVLVRVNDLNDNWPKFERSPYIVNLKEKSTFPRALLRLAATDLDSGSNGFIRFSIDSINGQEYNGNDPVFLIDDNRLVLNRFLDMDLEKTPKSFEIIVIAKDMGGLQTKTNVFVNLIDLNTFPPVIRKPKQGQVFEVEENVDPAKAVVRVEAFDPDFSNLKVKCELYPDLNGDYQSFSIDEQTGQVITKKVFDFEEKREYNLRFKCSDLAGKIISISFQ